MSTAQKRQLAPLNREVRLPRDWCYTEAVITPGVQENNRVVEVGQNIWRMGVNNPLVKDKPSATITLDHIRTTVALLTFWDHGKDSISVSYNELAHRAYGYKDKEAMSRLSKHLEDLRQYWVAVEYPDGSTRIFTIVSGIDVIKKPSRVEGGEPMFWLDKVSLHSEFRCFLNDLSQSRGISFEVLQDLTSDIAQSIYMFLPALAFHNDEKSPFKITTARLWTKLLLPPSPASVRYKILTQGKRSIMKQLDRKPISEGILRVDLARTSDKSDWNLVSWVEGQRSLPLSKSHRPSGKLWEAWIAGGRSEADYRIKIDGRQPLADYQIDTLTLLGIPVDGSTIYFEHVKALLGMHFDTILAEARMDKLSKKCSVNSWAATIRHRIEKKISSKRW